jgi:polyisoprenoid-binding protein YceI
MKILNSLTLGALLGFSSLFGTDFIVDKSHSSVSFKVRHMMVSNTKGHFENFKGKFSYDPKTQLLSTLNGEVKVESITTANEKRDDHLKGPDFFDAKKYPKIIVSFVNQEGSDVYVNLTMKDVTKKVKLEMSDASALITDPWGNERIGFVLDGKINRQDFGITFNKALETGGVLVGDEVKLSIELEGIAR